LRTSALGNSDVMARNETLVQATPEAIFTILADGRSYGHWVVGSSQVHHVEPGFPAVGTAFHHTVGFGPFRVSSEVRVEVCDPPRRLAVRARARPFGTALMTVELHPDTEGTLVVLLEDAGAGPAARLLNALTHLLVHGRSRESLRRLRALAEGAGS
jgi:carbon monoxide dehydrogenase subunit G